MSHQYYFERSMMGTSSVLGHKYMVATCFLMVSCKKIYKKTGYRNRQERTKINLRRFL